MKPTLFCLQPQLLSGVSAIEEPNPKAALVGLTRYSPYVRDELFKFSYFAKTAYRDVSGEMIHKFLLPAFLILADLRRQAPIELINAGRQGGGDNVAELCEGNHGLGRRAFSWPACIAPNPP